MAQPQGHRIQGLTLNHWEVGDCHFLQRVLRDKVTGEGKKPVVGFEYLGLYV